MKRGTTHIEAIVSFVLFFLFVGAGFYFFSPRTDQLADASLDYATREIIQNTTTHSEIYNLLLKKQGGNVPVCLNVDTNLKAVVLDEAGNVVPSSRVSGQSGIIHIRKQGNDDQYVRIVFSGDIIEKNHGDCNGPGACGSTCNSDDDTNDDFDIISSFKGDFVSEERLKQLKAKYDVPATYTQLVEQFNLPDRVDFGFSIALSDIDSECTADGIVAGKAVPEGVQIYVGKKRVEVLRSDGTRAFSDLVTSVW